MALSYLDLLRVFDTKQCSTLTRLLRAQGVKFMRDRRGRPITTDGELERAMHGRDAPRRMEFTKPPTRARRAAVSYHKPRRDLANGPPRERAASHQWDNVE
jgi:hypothetical protein